MTLNGHFALCYVNHASIGARHGSLKKVDPYRQQQKCKHVRIFVGGFLGEEPQTTDGRTGGRCYIA